MYYKRDSDVLYITVKVFNKEHINVSTELGLKWLLHIT